MKITGLESTEDYVTVNKRGYRFAYDAETSGPFTVDEIVTFSGAAVGTARVAEVIDDKPVAGEGYLIVSEPLTGGVAVDNAAISGGTSGASATVNGAVNSDIDKRQLSLLTSLTTNLGGTGSVVVNETIPTDTPSSGVIRVQDDNGYYRRIVYASYTGTTFTVGSSGTEDDFSTTNATGGTDAAGNNVYIGYIDKLAASDPEEVQVVYSGSPKNLFIRVRDGGAGKGDTPIKTFESTTSIASSDTTSSVIRTSDQ